MRSETPSSRPPDVPAEDVAIYAGDAGPAGDPPIFDGEVEPPAPEHVARCAQCPAGVKYRLTASGGGLVVLERYGLDVDASIGIGGTSRPLCPNGHGEMLNADEQLPVGEAIAQVNGATQPSLPGVVFAFNFEGAFTELVDQAKRVHGLKAEVDEAAEQHKDAVKAWKKQAELYTSMAIEFDRRRREKAGEPAEDLLAASERPAPEPGPCSFTAHSGQPCPLCTVGVVFTGAARDTEAHRAQAEHAALVITSENLADRLSDIGVVLLPRQILALEEELRNELVAWITDAEQNPEERARWFATLPRALGTAHLAGMLRLNTDDGSRRQVCGRCGETILELQANDEGYVVGMLVGEGCRGKRAREKKPAGTKPAGKKRGRKAKA